MEEHDSGEITEYQILAIIYTSLPIPMPIAPPLAPSPITTEIIGTLSVAIILILGNGLSLAAFFCFQPGISTRRIEKRNDGDVKLFAQLHQPIGFSIAFGVSHT